MKIFAEGHRGYCAKYPENTLISFEAAIDLGVYCFEFDVHLSKDKVPVIMHDANAKRTCGVDRKLCDMTLEEMAKSKTAFEFIKESIAVPEKCKKCQYYPLCRAGG